MNQEIEQLLLENGASMVGFAKIAGLYHNLNLKEQDTEVSVSEHKRIPQYSFGISIILSQPKDVIRNINSSPTMDYYHAYHRLNATLDNILRNKAITPILRPFRILRNMVTLEPLCHIRQ